ncbi:hypothetical protein RDI58_022185 [Solanum bulbocastanum]|uniref:Uncharacterized protein n=1 Tax=Solanum bulbocastanum TaxID=147425 RepID=A0AAN8T7C0_SOLBU
MEKGKVARLGLCFKTTFPLELSPPVVKGEKLLPHSVRPDWFGGKYRYSWSSVTKRWIDRVDRVEKSKGEVWKFGMMGPTILDIVTLTGQDGKEVGAMLGMAGLTINFSMCRGRNSCDRESTYIFSVYVAQRASVL